MLTVFPHDVWLYLFTYLSEKERFSIGRVNKSFLRLSRDQKFWKKYCIDNFIKYNQEVETDFATVCAHVLRQEDILMTQLNEFVFYSVAKPHLIHCLKRNDVRISDTEELIVQDLLSAQLSHSGGLDYDDQLPFVDDVRLLDTVMSKYVSWTGKEQHQRHKRLTGRDYYEDVFIEGYLSDDGPWLKKEHYHFWPLGTSSSKIHDVFPLDFVTFEDEPWKVKEPWKLTNKLEAQSFVETFISQHLSYLDIDFKMVADSPTSRHSEKLTSDELDHMAGVRQRFRESSSELVKQLTTSFRNNCRFYMAAHLHRPDGVQKDYALASIDGGLIKIFWHQNNRYYC